MSWILPFYLLASFLLGAVPFGLIVARLGTGVDVRTTGSGNIGATNVARSAGLGPGILTLVLDAAKGLAPVLVAEAVCDGGGLAPGLAGLAAFLGHLYSPFLGFKGGKGVATALGVLLGLTPWAVPPSLLIFVAIVARWGYVSAGSMAAALIAPLTAMLLGYSHVDWGLTVVIAGFIVLRHRENLGRLARGEENKWRSRKEE
ncbi:MAG: glycerol-3-phosphate 1-O-acyltransferase PlsY [Proteobacteria bacterium]|nr:glycerol-3-phosphate 1-O-acyltransferase PlsY [Pseudomonadota bacterium]